MAYPWHWLDRSGAHPKSSQRPCAKKALVAAGGLAQISPSFYKSGSAHFNCNAQVKAQKATYIEARLSCSSGLRLGWVFGVCRLMQEASSSSDADCT